MVDKDSIILYIERDRETDRDRDRKIDRHTETDRDRKIDRQADTLTQKHTTNKKQIKHAPKQLQPTEQSHNPTIPFSPAYQQSQHPQSVLD